MSLGQLYLRTGAPQRAVELLRPLTAVSSGTGSATLGANPDLHFTLGQAYLALRDTRRAESSLTLITAKHSEAATQKMVEFLSKNLTPEDLCCFSGSLPSGTRDTLYAETIALCKSRGAVSLLDGRGVPFRAGSRAKPTAIKPNIDEIEELFGEPVRGVHHLALKGKKLLDSGIPYVFISLGADGAIALHENDCMLCVPPLVDAVDTVGCGDAFVAGMMVAWKRKFSFTESCRLAVACGAAKALREGPSSLNADKAWQFMEEVGVTAV